MSTCSYCRGSLTGSGLTGRPWPDCPAATYCCFGCLSLGEQRAQASTALATGWKLDGLGVRLGIGLLVAGQSMIFGLALNLHDDVPPNVRWFVQTCILAATVLVIALLGGPLFRTAWSELGRGRLTIEALFLLTMIGAMMASLQAHFTGHGKIYFEVVSVLLVVYVSGKVIGARSRATALASSRAWAGQLDVCRRIDEKGRSQVVPVVVVQPGDVVEVNPGETVAVDGVIRDGIGFVSEAAVSGEPFAVIRRPGDRVLAGVASHDATLRIEVTAKGTERQVDRLLAAVEQARDRPTSLQGQADRLGQAFFPLVVLVALGTFGYWTFLAAAGWEVGLFNAMSVLLVSCPCAIGLATPIVIWAALGRLAERGLIAHAGDAIERLAAIDHVMLDKTGTLTDDSFALLDVATIATGDARARLLGLLSVIQERSAHPVARPFARLPRPFAPGEEPHVLSLRIVPGCGVEAGIEDADNTRHVIQIGTPRWIDGACRSDRTRQADLTAQLLATGHRVDVAIDGRLVAVAVLAERLRDSATTALAGFRKLALAVETLTGDTAERAAALNLPTVRGGLLPDDKRMAVEAAKAAGRKPLFVGDGINDASALATAHAGIAIASGTDVAIGAASMTLYHGDLRILPWAVEVSREAIRLVRRNLYRALCYNLLGMTLAASGFLHPVVAAVLMVTSSLMLIFSSCRVGTLPIHCVDEEPEAGSQALPVQRDPGSTGRAIAHGVAMALQGVVVLLLLDSVRELPAAALVLGGFAFGGMALGRLWQRWRAIPHALDMAVGMLTLGNLGMLLGWWADNGFAPLQDSRCCRCVEGMRTGLLQPWMWVGMLLGANAAMLGLARCPNPPGGRHPFAAYLGGNLGMVLGMFAGGWSAAYFAVDVVGIAVVVSFAAMTVGMVAGMLLGTWLFGKGTGVVGAARALPRWFRSAPR